MLNLPIDYCLITDEVHDWYRRGGGRGGNGKLLIDLQLIAKMTGEVQNNRGI